MQKLLALLGAKAKGICCAACTVYQVWPCWRKQHGGIDGGVLYLLWISPDLYMVGSVLGTILSIANAFFGTISLCLPGMQTIGAVN